MLKDISELENRLFDIALQAPDDGGDIFDDAFADPAEVAERKAAKKEAAAKQDATMPKAAEGGNRATGMNKEMKKRQEETAAEVRRCISMCGSGLCVECNLVLVSCSMLACID